MMRLHGSSGAAGVADVRKVRILVYLCASFSLTHTLFSPSKKRFLQFLHLGMSMLTPSSSASAIPSA